MNRVKVLLILSTFFLISCSKGLENEAKLQMEKTMKELAKDPSSVQISNVDIKYSNDSICIIHAKFSGKNGFGGVGSNEIEYVYLVGTNVKTGEKTKSESVIKLDEDKSVLKKAHDLYDQYKDSEDYKSMSDEEKKAHIIFDTAVVHIAFFGRDIDKKSNDVDKW